MLLIEDLSPQFFDLPIQKQALPSQLAAPTSDRTKPIPSPLIDRISNKARCCACRKSNPDILAVQPAESWAARVAYHPFPP